MRFRVRTLLFIVALIAFALWAVPAGSRSIEYARRARYYAEQEHHWRLSASEGAFPRDFCLDSADYLGGLAAKYRRARWRFWETAAPDPKAPGFAAYEEQQRRAARALSDAK